MIRRTALPFVVLACCFMLVGCKKTVAFLVMDAQTEAPLVTTLVDHYSLYEYPDERAGEPYLMDTLPVDENGWVEIKKPKKGDAYTFRLAGYQDLRVRMPKPGETAEYLKLGGPNKKQWIELEFVDDKEEKGKDKVPTVIIPLKKSS